MINSYIFEYEDYNGKTGIAYECEQTTFGNSLICYLKDGTIIQVKKFNKKLK